MPSVLVTGTSRGIGHFIAIHLAANRWDVFAGVRNEEDATEVKAASQRITPVILDITNSDHLAALDGSLPERLDAVVNNAAMAVGGPMEAVTPAELRRRVLGDAGVGLPLADVIPHDHQHIRRSAPGDRLQERSQSGSESRMSVTTRPNDCATWHHHLLKYPVAEV